MIELITGLPGNGKTLYTISYIKGRAQRENRPVFYNGIPDLTLNWERLDDPREWAKCPPGSIIVIDEAQKTFRNRSMGSIPPDFVQQLETHRHLGIDLILITQHPSLIDPAVRRLAGSHRHMVRIWGMEASTIHQWPAVKDNCDKSRGDSEKTKWAFDKTVYGYYKSAEVHTMKRTIPGRVKLLGGLVLVFFACVWYTVSFVMKKTSAPAPVVASASSSPAPGQFVPKNTNTTHTSGAAAPDPLFDAQQYVYRETPRVAGLPQTAPKYDELTKPVRVPVPAMCVQIGDVHKSGLRCKCYTQQGTPMALDFNQCIDIAQHGFFLDFDPEAKKAELARSEAGQAVLKDRPDAPLPSDRERGPQVAVIENLPDRPLTPVRVTGDTKLH